MKDPFLDCSGLEKYYEIIIGENSCAHDVGNMNFTLTHDDRLFGDFF